MSEAKDFSAAQGEIPAGYSLEAGVSGERAEQAALFNACFTKDLDEADLSWRYEENPYGESVNILARDQEDIAMRFAGMDGTDRNDRFGLGSWTDIATGAPVLEGALVGFDCTIADSVTAGTHTIFIGRIVGIQHQQGAPLLFGNGEFTGLANQG